MRLRRRNRGFEPGGSFPPEQLGLSRVRARELILQRAWRRIVGPMTDRIRIVQLRRGVLFMAVEAAEEEERATLLDMLPTLVGRLAAACPGVGIRRFRVDAPGGYRDGPVTPIEMPASKHAEPGGSRSRQAAESAARPEQVDPATRLGRLMQRCLERSQKP